ncbi:TonB family protein [Hymenobacter cellulosivorans]|uniref:TonB family protein n=1 Tax=Hymenobacter cellulosivorans TaxID=2932249 RepID=A0ABY4FC88_9BACT|nr:TonB family protein [Hymenobacter cellulosivorans]UOQ53776.1 TonB family protein [Hymenobacter cellulosivorans]
MTAIRLILALSGVLLPAAAYAQTTTMPDAAPAAVKYDRLPEYIGGSEKMLQDLGRNTRYAAAALRARAEGKVNVTFIVDATGSATDMRVLDSSSPLLNESALQAVRALGKFRPAMQGGQAVPAPMTIPISFKIMQSGPAKPIAVAPVAAVQPQANTLVGSTTVEKIASFRDSTYQLATKKSLVQRHYFTYDVAGQPATHRVDVVENGKVISSNTWRYEYAKSGPLLTKINADGRRRYSFSYDNAGQLTKITQQYRPRDKWELMSETLLERQPGPDGTTQLAFSLSTKRYEGMSSFGRTDYTLNAEGSLVASTVRGFNYKPLEKPWTYSFEYDSSPNPLHNLFPSAGSPLEVEDSGLHNLIRKQKHDQSARPSTSTYSYTYTAHGNPVEGVGRNSSQRPYRYLTYRYANITVPAARSGAATSATGLTVFPNPASSKTTVTAKGIGRGEATLRLYDATGQLQRQASFATTSAEQAETILSVSGLASGVYTVEIAGPAATASGKLLVP